MYPYCVISVEWGTQFNFKFKVPESYTDIVGEKVLMQWQYVTANSCMPAGYKNSAIGNFLNSKGWLRNGGNLVDCVEPYSLIGNGAPEQVRPTHYHITFAMLNKVQHEV